MGPGRYWDGMGRRVGRRELLRGTGVGVMGVALAGCTTPAGTPTVAPTSPPAAAPTSGALAAATATRLDGVTKLEAVDKATLRITVDRPNADLLWSIATARCKVIPKESVAVKGDLKEGPVIGSGPWIFDSFQANQASAMKRNPDYYFKGQPYLDGVIWLRIADQATLLNAFRSKNLDLL